jgi:hypothetical protein
MGKVMARFGMKQFLFALGFLFVIGAASGAQAQGYGALAVAPDGAWGSSRNFDSLDVAQDRAVQECNKHSRGCQILRVFQNVCVTVARNEDSKNVILNWVAGFNAEERSSRSLRNCRNDGGNDCRILTEFCTGNAR